MANAKKPPLITDPDAFINSASAQPAPRPPIGAKAGDVSEVIEQKPEEGAKTKAAARKPGKATKQAEPKKKPEVKPSFPWMEANPKVKNFFQVRMPEPMIEKLRWIVENSTGRPSMQKFALEAIEQWADAKIAELTKQGG